MSSAAYPGTGPSAPGGPTPSGGPAASGRPRPPGGLWALVACVGIAVLVIILAAGAGIVFLVVKRDSISPRATEVIETDIASFEAPRNWTDLGSQDDELYDFHYDRQQPTGAAARILVASTSEPVPSDVLCDSFSESLSAEGAQVSDAEAAVFDGETSQSFTARIQDGTTMYLSEYHCVSHDGTTVLVLFQTGKSPARTAEGEKVISTWHWR
ncbi:hypothetical protein [Brachybacterium phenoliresistens]|uniref:hypothetical protein n=1 Tax=Brachybacterium phenoliresistens TaxID=396014 RepID=UPI0012EBA8BF|nr:hypothetical protein [Brachybacterium phenoliresistens]